MQNPAWIVLERHCAGPCVEARRWTCCQNQQCDIMVFVEMLCFSSLGLPEKGTRRGVNDGLSVGLSVVVQAYCPLVIQILVVCNSLLSHIGRCGPEFHLCGQM